MIRFQNLSVSCLDCVICLVLCRCCNRMFVIFGSMLARCQIFLRNCRTGFSRCIRCSIGSCFEGASGGAGIGLSGYRQPPAHMLIAFVNDGVFFSFRSSSVRPRVSSRGCFSSCVTREFFSSLVTSRPEVYLSLSFVRSRFCQAPPVLICICGLGVAFSLLVRSLVVASRLVALCLFPCLC